MTRPIRLGISTCPNDTFAFHGLLTRAVNWRGLAFEVELLDIQQLNAGLFSHRFDVAKTSFHAALRLTADYLVLPSGSAVGFGVGPLLLAATNAGKPAVATQCTLCPGADTTAALLFQLFYGDTRGSNKWSFLKSCRGLFVVRQTLASAFTRGGLPGSSRA